MVSWLPSYHDMGLVGFIIVPAFTGAHCVSMSPISFIKDAAVWMDTASRYRATHVCAPNFGFALAARKTKDHVRDTLNLSALRQAICAAEPIRSSALDAFAAKFGPVGFRRDTFRNFQLWIRPRRGRAYVLRPRPLRAAGAHRAAT